MWIYQRSQTETEEKPAAGIKRQEMKILIGHVHWKNSDYSYQQSRRKMHESKNVGIFDQIFQGIGKSCDHREYV